jgi:hypothetical protein
MMHLKPINDQRNEQRNPLTSPNCVEIKGITKLTVSLKPPPWLRPRRGLQEDSKLPKG